MVKILEAYGVPDEFIQAIAAMYETKAADQELQTEFWEDVYDEYDAHKAYDIFLDKLTLLL